MKSVWIGSFLSSVLLLGSAPVWGEDPEGKRYAVLVGVKEYDDPKLPPLKFAENDMVKLAELLRTAGYKVVLLCDSAGAKDARNKPTLANIRSELKAVLDGCRKGDTILVALAGQGLQFDGESYFCPRDAKAAVEQVQTLLSLGEIYKGLEKSPASARLLLIDACRLLPGKDQKLRGIDGDNAPLPPEGVTALFSCRKGQLSHEHPNHQHSVFFYHVLEGLSGKIPPNRHNQITWDKLAEYVRRQVMADVPALLGKVVQQEPLPVGDPAGKEPVLLGKDNGGRSTKDQPAPRAFKEITNSFGMKLVHIPAGKFLMGSPEEELGRQADEARHEVILTRHFYLGKYPVTHGQFARFVRETGYQTEPETDGKGGWGFNAATGTLGTRRKPQYTWRNPGFAQTADHPVVNLTWKDAEAFCKWLSKKEATRYRLPTEAEWEYACRAGTTARFFTDEDDDSLEGYANVADQTLKALVGKKYSDVSYFEFADGCAFTSPVGQFKPNSFGLCDMTGNVWQICADWYAPYDLANRQDPRGPRQGRQGVMRGGSWLDLAPKCRSAHREKYEFDGRSYHIGFRVVRAE